MFPSTSVVIGGIRYHPPDLLFNYVTFCLRKYTFLKSWWIFLRNTTFWHFYPSVFCFNKLGEQINTVKQCQGRLYFWKHRIGQTCKFPKETLHEAYRVFPISTIYVYTVTKIQLVGVMVRTLTFICLETFSLLLILNSQEYIQFPI